MTDRLLTRLLDIVAPRACTICGRRLMASQSAICAVCHLHLPLTQFWLTPYDNIMARLLWGRIPLAGGEPLQRPNSVERAAALFFYQPHAPASKIIYDLKYHAQRNLGEAMGRIAAATMAGSGFFEGIDVIVPIPLTRHRQWSRGYNQSMEIAKGVSNVTDIPVDESMVRRNSFHGSQTKLQAWERADNVETAFELVSREKAENRHMLLIDDVMTTGATIAACACQLCKARDVRISVLTLGFTRQ